MNHYNEAPKAPPWISTAAGQWAWVELLDWRRTAADALSVHERRELLEQAEQLRQAAEANAQ